MHIVLYKISDHIRAVPLIDVVFLEDFIEPVKEFVFGKVRHLHRSHRQILSDAVDHLCGNSIVLLLILVLPASQISLLDKAVSDIHHRDNADVGDIDHASHIAQPDTAA